MLFLLSMITNVYINVIQKNIYVYYIIHKINVIYCRNLKLNAEKKGNFMKKKLFILLLICINCTSICLAHKGRTDSSGGHYDYSTGEYHYHHGYSAHQHNNGVCPYETNKSNLLPSICPNCQATINEENGDYCFECAYKLPHISNVNGLILVDGDVTKTRSQYFEEVQQLKSRIDEKDVIINDLNIEISNKKNEIEKLKQENSNQKSSTGMIIIVTILIILVIEYVLYKKRNVK